MSSECCHNRLRVIVSVFLAAVLTLAAASCAPTGVYHVVEPGQTLYRIAKAYDIDEGRLASVNGVIDPTRLEAGQRLFIPGATLTRDVPVPTPPRKAASPLPSPVIKDKPAPKTSKKTQPTEPKSGASANVIPGTAPVPGTFVWPVRGKVVSEFGTVAGKASKGLEIAVPHGTSVVAAAAGKVIYSNDMRGYGKLIILEHADNYFTVYGFNAKNLVAVDNYVGQGEKIALSGSPGGGKSPRLHFEIRKGKTAVNPIFFLP